MVLRLIVGDDPILVGEAISASVEELVGDGDRSLMLELLTETDYRNDDGDWESAKVLDGPNPAVPHGATCRRRPSSQPVLPQGRLRPDYHLLGEPLETTDLVLVWERGVEPKVDRMPALPKALKEAAELAGAEVLQTSAPKGKGAATGCAISSRRAR